MGYRNAAGGEEPDPVDASLDVLADSRRRSLCRYASRTRSETVTREELVDHLVERGGEPGEGTVDRGQIEAELCHVHLPKLDAVGVVEYEPRRGTVRVDRETLTAHLERIRAVVANLQEPVTDE